MSAERAPAWVIWSEEHQAWWRPFSFGYSFLLSGAGLYSEAQAKEIAFDGNAFCEIGEWKEVALPDPLGRRL